MAATYGAEESYHYRRDLNDEGKEIMKGVRGLLSPLAANSSIIQRLTLFRAMRPKESPRGPIPVLIEGLLEGAIESDSDDTVYRVTPRQEAAFDVASYDRPLG
jgi:hypothetical protein